jgi:hypothetical protein
MIRSLNASITTVFKQLIIWLILNIAVDGLYAQTLEADSVFKMEQQTLPPGLNDGEGEVEEELLTDTILNIRAIGLSPDTILQWKNKKEFIYVKNLDSLLKVNQAKEDASSNGKVSFSPPSFLDNIFNGSFLKMILWMLAAFFVLMVIYQLIKNKGFFHKVVTKGVEEETAEPEADIMAQNFDLLIQQSFKTGDYRMATRYQFLKTLQLLSDHNQVDYAADKTNSRYVQELPVHWRNDFARLILSYEYVWYGNFALTLQQYESLQQQYSSFRKKI